MEKGEGSKKLGKNEMGGEAASEPSRQTLKKGIYSVSATAMKGKRGSMV